MGNRTEMTPTEFRQASISRSRKEDVEITVEQSRMLLCSTGLAGEAGEVADSMKKHVWHGKPFDREHTIEEIGDVLWYADRLLWLLDCSMEECLQTNADKLAARWPDGFKKEEPVEPDNFGEAAMVYLNGSKRAFKCHCSCNVFSTLPNSMYVCNACGTKYQGS